MGVDEMSCLNIGDSLSLNDGLTIRLPEVRLEKGVVVSSDTFSFSTIILLLLAAVATTLAMLGCSTVGFLADFFEVGMETGLLVIVSSDVSFSTTLLLPAATLPIP